MVTLHTTERFQCLVHDAYGSGGSGRDACQQAQQRAFTATTRAFDKQALTGFNAQCFDRQHGRGIGLPAEFEIADVDDQIIRPLVDGCVIARLELYDVIARRQFRGTLFGLDHILHLDFLHAAESLEQFNR